ncbi:MAG: type I pullulanase [Clostridiales bacterium]|nr:type I pullulanase [Clostridiales bacterium]
MTTGKMAKKVAALLLALALLIGCGFLTAVPKAEAQEGPIYYYSISTYDWNDTPVITGLPAGVTATFEPGNNNPGVWRTARFTSTEASMDLTLNWGNGRAAYYSGNNARFKLTADYPNVYLFAGGSGNAQCTVYATPLGNETTKITVLASSAQAAKLAGDKIGWTPIALTGATAVPSELLPGSSPSAYGTVQMYSYTYPIGPAGLYTDEFKLVTGTSNWHPGGEKNAAWLVSSGYSIKGPGSFAKPGNHQFTLGGFMPNGATGNVTGTNWRIDPAVAGFTINSTTGVVTTTSSTPDATITVKADYGGTTYTGNFPYSGSAHTFILHYYQYPTANYTDWNIWMWGESPAAGGIQIDFAAPSGGWVTATKSLPGSEWERVGLIVRKGNWEDKSNSKNIYLDLTDPTYINGNGEFECWFLDRENVVYPSKPDTGAKPVGALADWDNYVRVAMNFDPGGMNGTHFQLWDITPGSTPAPKTISARVYAESDRRVVHIDTPSQGASPGTLVPDRLYEVRYSTNNFSTWKSVPVTMRNILGMPKYQAADTDLGLTYGPTSSQFKLWAPTAKTVEVAIYETLNQDVTSPSCDLENIAGLYRVKNSKLIAPDNLYPMVRGSNGLWTGLVARNDLDGKHYMYKVTFPDGKVNFAIDPYATSTSANGQLTAIIDLAATNTVRPLAPSAPSVGYNTDHILYELHVRDFTMHQSSGVPVNLRGSYEGAAMSGTTVNSVTGNPKTGIDHLVELGVTTVHFLPIYDYGSVNELGDLSFDAAHAFNWGYDPMNYNVPEGSYSSDPTDPYARVNELKDLISALHDAGIRVVLDVVYNHTYDTTNGPFDRAVPGYYYRTWDNGNFSDGSGCGNEVASDHPMVGKYIVDSVLYWQREYGMDGFRFDLMALIDENTMEKVVIELKKADPHVIVYGEPWAADGTPLTNPTVRGSQKGKGFAYFNDDTREAIKGGNDDNTKGFASGKTGAELSMAAALKAQGWHGNYSEDKVGRASETVAYAGAHDNLVLWDKMQYTFGTDINTSGYKSNPYGGNFANAKKASILANGIVLTAHGIPFFHAGDEFLRSKKGNHNSYNANDTVNAIDWTNKLDSKYGDVFKYYQGLIALRLNHPAFRVDDKGLLDDTDNPANFMYFHKLSDQVVAYSLKGSMVTDCWNTIYVAYNGSGSNKTVNFGVNAELTIVVNQDNAGITPLGTFQGNTTYTLPPYSMLVAYDVDTTPPIPTAKRGDANCDGEVDAADAAAILRFLAGLSDLSDQGAINAEVTDVTPLTPNRAAITAEDAAKILRFLANIITVL